jgi:23S rRNA pseudouridine2605 synthase
MKLKVSDLNLQDNNDVENKIRLQLYLARCGVASRRGSEVFITDGRVSVNGVIVTELGTKVSLEDVVCVDGKQVTLEESKKYVLLNKPAGYVCSLADEKNRPVAADLLKPHFTERLYNVGRLDMFSQGLIIFTNDGEFAKEISHPSSGIEKEYLVETSLPIPSRISESFMKGIRIDGVFYKCRKAEQLSARQIKIVLVEGKNREIRRVFEKFEIGIKSLTRTRIGTIAMDDLEVGQYRELTQTEIENLRSLI